MLRLATLLTAALLLTGCAGMRLVESTVRTTTPANAAPIEAGATYRFERLPSQQDQVETDSIEAIAEAELSAVGLVRDEAGARYSVLLTTRMQSFLADDWGRPSNGPRMGGTIIIGGGGFGTFGGGGFGIGSGPMIGSRFPPPTNYRHEATLLLRELSSNQVVYETSATHTGPWSDRYNVLRAVLAAALQGFPTPPAGARSVKVEIPR